MTLTQALLVLVYGQLCYVLGCIVGRHVVTRQEPNDHDG